MFAEILKKIQQPADITVFGKRETKTHVSVKPVL
jgi:hypothetical protein